MAKYRPIYVNIWSDPDFEEYSAYQKLIFIYLFSNSATTESGIYPITFRKISNDTQITIEEVKRSIKGIKNVKYDYENKVVFIKNFYKYRSAGGGRSDLVEKSIKNNYKDIKTSFWDDFFILYPEFKYIKDNHQTQDNSKYKGKGNGNNKDKCNEQLLNSLPTVSKSSDKKDSLAEYLYFKIKEVKPDFKEPNLDKWGRQINEIITVDKRNPDNIKAVIDWAYKDDFWKTKILSPKNLRNNYDTLEIQINEAKERKIKKERDELRRKALKCYRSFNGLSCGTNSKPDNDQCELCRSEINNSKL